jgi:hypothetical protein
VKKIWIPLIFTVLALAACTAQPTPIAAPPPTATPSAETPTAEPTKSAGRPSQPLPSEKGELFSASGICASCHTNMTDEAGNDVSTDAFWRASMMANASRDPYWQASVKGEVLSHPDFKGVIEDKCATCHMPMARFTATTKGDEGAVFEQGFLDAENPLHTLALDGVSCNLCHQIREVGFGEFASFSGGFVIDTELPMGERLAYGPYPVQDELAQVMQSASGFVPVQRMHIEESELCATCHTLYTPYVDATGRIAGKFPEQTPYLEWIQSDYLNTDSCQGCHMPQAEGGVQLSVTGGPLREPFYQHVFAGGNAYMLGILNTYAEELQVRASKQEIVDKSMSVKEMLQNRTATVTLAETRLEGSELTAVVAIESQVGHKFPSGFPSRRAWLHFVVRDSAGDVVFESGAVDVRGFIAGNDNDVDPEAYEPHYQEIGDPDQVQIYEAIMEDPEGGVTTILLRGAGYAKDNRLLPRGFDKEKVQEDIAVQGEAQADQDFLGGEDRVRYAVQVGEAQGPFTVTVKLFYQTIGYRWAEKLRGFDSAESERFLRYYESVPNLPVLIASAQAQVSD